MKDPINPELDGLILTVGSLKAILNRYDDEKQIILRTTEGDCHVSMDDLEVFEESDFDLVIDMSNNFKDILESLNADAEGWFMNSIGLPEIGK